MKNKKSSRFVVRGSLLVGGLIVAAVVAGCRTAGGKAETTHLIETYDTNGVLMSRVTKVDYSYMGVKGLFASDSAVGLKHSRTNFIGSASSTQVGRFSGQPEAAAITAAGSAIGTAVGAAMGKVIPDVTVEQKAGTNSTSLIQKGLNLVK